MSVDLYIETGNTERSCRQIPQTHKIYLMHCFCDIDRIPTTASYVTVHHLPPRAAQVAHEADCLQPLCSPRLDRNQAHAHERR